MEDDSGAGDDNTFCEHVHPLAEGAYFRYLGQILTGTDDDCMEVVKKPLEGEANLVEALVDPGEGVGRHAYIGAFISVHGLVNPYLWIGGVCGDPPHQEGPGVISPSGNEVDNGETPKVTIRWELSVPHVGGQDVVGGIVGDENLHLQEV